jgi:hypothetical protein
MKKRFYLNIILLLLSLAMIFALCACGNKEGSEQNGITEETKEECKHEWKRDSSLLATCEEIGVNNLSCTLCGERKSTPIPANGHDYTAEWEWAEDYSYASVKLSCSVSKDHYKHISCIVKDETVKPTCQSRGTRKIMAIATVDGVDYIDTKEFDLGLGSCINSYNFTLSGNSCEDGFDMEAVCTVCGKKSYASFNSHIIFEVYSDTVCGGEATVKLCPCKENVIFDYPEGCDAEVENKTWQETDENGIVHTLEHRFCLHCGFELIYDKYARDEGCYSFVSRLTKIMDGEKELYSFLEENYETQSYHELSYTYDGGKIDSCENGYTCHVACKQCSYAENIETTTHDLTFLTVKYDLSKYGACGGYIQERECPCGLNKTVFYSLACDYDYSEYIEDGLDGGQHFVKTYTCNECKMELIFDQYIKDENVYASYTLKINGEIKYEYKEEE